MEFELKDWDIARKRVIAIAQGLKAECRTLMTRNVGGEHDVEVNEKEKAISGKLLIRRIPQEIDDVIETRIAVVGNGMRSRHATYTRGALTSLRSRCR